MSDDIVKRLRVQANRRSGCAHMMSDGSIKWHPMLDDAADEIERLTAELAALRAQLDEACEALEEAETVMSWMLLEGVDEVIHETCPKEYERFVFAHAFVAELVEKIKGGGDE